MVSKVCTLLLLVNIAIVSARWDLTCAEIPGPNTGRMPPCDEARRCPAGRECCLTRKGYFVCKKWPPTPRPRRRCPRPDKDIYGQPCDYDEDCPNDYELCCKNVDFKRSCKQAVIVPT